MQIDRIFVSPDHNYFGHHGKPAGNHPAIETTAIECVAGRGIRGDRFFDYRPDYRGQITFFALEVHLELCARFGLGSISPAVYRRNVITCGVDLAALIGQVFEVQGLRFEGMAECSPCHWMDQALHPGAEKALKGRGGLRARILRGGWLRTELSLLAHHAAA